MNIDLSAYTYTGEWVEFKPADPEKGAPAVRLLIRPYPDSMGGIAVKQGGEFVYSGQDSLKQFNHCLLGWDGLDITINGEPALCTPETKKIIFDFDIEGIATFVGGEILRMKKRKPEILKN